MILAVNSISVIILFRWEAARDWKEENPKGTMQNFNVFWASIQQDKDKVQVPLIRKSPSRANFVTCIRCIKTEQSNLYVLELIYLIVAILMISFLEHWQFKFDEVIPLSIRFRLGGNGTLARCSKARRKGGGGDTGEMELLAVVYWREYGRW
jgi:hypothetical protein